MTSPQRQEPGVLDASMGVLLRTMAYDDIPEKRFKEKSGAGYSMGLTAEYSGLGQGEIQESTLSLKELWTAPPSQRSFTQPGAHGARHTRQLNP